MSGWGKEWIIPNTNADQGWPEAKPMIEWPTEAVEDILKYDSGITPELKGWPNVGVAINEIKNLKSQGSNLVDSEAYLYFQCEGCSTILDPHTKSFKILQEQRVKEGWKCIWNTNGQGYKVFCVKCGNGK